MGLSGDHRSLKPTVWFGPDPTSSGPRCFCMKGNTMDSRLRDGVADWAAGF